MLDNGGPVETIRVLVADDHDLFRLGLSKLFALQNEIQVVGEAKDGGDAVQKAAALLPDLILMDLAMPEKNGLEATRLIKKEHPEIEIAILTVLDDKHYRLKAKKVGADAYLLKGLPFEKLLERIKALVNKGKH